MKLLSLFSRPFIGLDIQPHGLRLVQLRKNRRGTQIERVIAADLPAAIFNDGKIEDWDALRETLTAVIRNAGLRNVAAAITLPASLVRMQHVRFPSGLTDKAVAAEVDAQVRRDLPGMAEVLRVDFSILPLAGSCDMNVFIAAARQAYLSRYVDCINAAGLRVKIVDVDIYALLRAVNYAVPESVNEMRAIFFAVSETASLLIHNSKEIVFHSQWHAADKIEFAARLKSQLQVCRAALGKMQIDRLSVCCNRKYHELLQQDLNQHWLMKIDYPDPFMYLRSSRPQKLAVAEDNSAEYLVACGAAMREIPQW